MSAAAPTAHLNAIGTAVPPHDVHAAFVDYAQTFLPAGTPAKLFARMAERSGIAHRYSTLAPGGAGDAADREGFYRRGKPPSTAPRMARFASDATHLVDCAVADLAARAGPGWADGATHVIVTSCTGFAAPGIDHHIVERHGLARDVERTFVGFMGCNAALNALKLARHIVRATPTARVLMVNLELCTLHFKEVDDVEQALLFLLFADGCAASIVSAEPHGLALDRFGQTLVPGTADAITWHIGDLGFDMHLSGQVPRHIGAHLPAHVAALLGQTPQADVAHWAVHPGGRSVLDAVEASLGLAASAMAASREVLRAFGNMSSATIMFVLQALLAGAPGRGVALGFGPGIGVESLAFRRT